MVSAAVLVFGSLSGRAAFCAEAVELPATAGWAGTAGAGPMVFPKYVGGKSVQVWLVPLLSINYKETFYIELERAGVYVLASDDKKIGLGLAIEPRFGHTARDGDKLAGMATRKDSLEGGPTFDWDFDVLAISIAYFGDLNRSSRGRSFRSSMYKPLFKDSRWDVGALLSFDRMNRRLGDYFFGVNTIEASAIRPAFHPGAATNAALGISGTFNIGLHHAIMFGANMARLDKRLAESPIVETRRAGMFYIGYGWTL